MTALYQKNLRQVEVDLPRIAVHEAGHAVVSFCCNKVVSIASAYINSDDGGVIFFFKDINTPEFNYAKIVIYLAGLAAELFIYKNINGIHAKKDLLSAFDLLNKLMTQNLTNIKIKKSNFDITKVYSNKFSNIEKEILNSAFFDAQNIIKSFNDKYYKLVSLLLTKNKISESDIELILGSRLFIKFTGQNSDSDVQFILPKQTLSLIERIKQWVNNNLFQKLHQYLTKLTHMLNS